MDGANVAKPKRVLMELWKRIVFSMAVSDTDDYFRNHGFILTDEGWELQPVRIYQNSGSRDTGVSSSRYALNL